MRKYRAVFKGKCIQMLNYWGPQLVWIISSFMSLFAITAIWLSANSNHEIAGYTKNQLITYAVVGLVAGSIMNVSPFQTIRQKIKDGSFATSYMLKPISFYFERLVSEGTWRLYFLAYNLLAAILACLYFSKYLSFSFRAEYLPILIVTMVFATLLQFTLSVCLGMLAFWYTEVNALNSLKWVALGILGGTALPISFIPNVFQVLVRILPFRYMYSFPVEIFFNKLTSREIFIGLALQVAWLAILIVIYKLMLRSGIKKYVSVGQ